MLANLRRVPPPAAPAGRGGFGGRGAAPNPDDLVARVGEVKSEMMAFTEMPCATLMKQYAGIELAYPKAVADLNAVYAKAAAMAPALQQAQVTLNPPAQVVWTAKPAAASTPLRRHP